MSRTLCQLYTKPAGATYGKLEHQTVTQCSFSMARANDQFATVDQDINQPFVRINSTHKALHIKERGDFETNGESAKRTPSLNQGKDCSLSSSRENLIEIKRVGFLVEKPMMDLLSPRLAAKDRGKSSSLPSLATRHSRNLPPGSEHFEMAASKTFDKAPNVMTQKRKGEKPQLATNLLRKYDTREGTKNGNCHLEDSLAILTLSAPGGRQLSRSPDCLRRKALLRPSTLQFGSKSAPNSPTQVTQAPQFTHPSYHSRYFTESVQEDFKRRGSCPNVSSYSSPPSKRRFETCNRTVNGGRMLMEQQKCPQPGLAGTGGGIQERVNAKSLSVPSCRSAPNSPPQITKVSHLNYASRHLAEAEQKDAKRRDSCPIVSHNMPPVSPALRRKFETSDRAFHGARMLIDEHRRSRPFSADDRQARLSAKSLSVALDEVKNCRYLRVVKRE